MSGERIAAKIDETSFKYPPKLYYGFKGIV